jgi:hypothetical protein
MVKGFFPDSVLVVPIRITKRDPTGPRINASQPAKGVVSCSLFRHVQRFGSRISSD